jgi:hypothetical protein
MQNILNHLQWIEELLPPDIISKNMHGGLGYFLNEKLVLILIESSLTYEYKGVAYPFKIWNGCFFPIVRIKQNAVFAKFSFLENHPASKNWLYLPADSEDFSDEVKAILREIKKGNPLFGIIPPIKKTKSSETETNEDEVGFSRPRLFSDEPVVATKLKPKKVKADKPKSNKKIKANKKSSNDLLLSVLKRSSGK